MTALAALNGTERILRLNSSIDGDTDSHRINFRVGTSSPKIQTFLSLLTLSSVFTGLLPTASNVAVGGGSESSSSSILKFKNKFNCPYGFQGRYCDACGISTASPNVKITPVNGAKIVGGTEAVRGSWPGAALIVFRFKADVFLNDINEVYNLNEKYMCGGTLINRDTIISAAHCVVAKIDFHFRGRQYSVEAKPNNYFPTYESMYTVYLGVHSSPAALADANVLPGVRATVGRVIRVSY
jgi:hypothetical protein